MKLKYRNTYSKEIKAYIEWPELRDLIAKHIMDQVPLNLIEDEEYSINIDIRQLKEGGSACPYSVDKWEANVSLVRLNEEVKEL